MKILVCISRTPDTTAKVRFSADGKKFIEEGVSFIMNPYDEWYALVRAVEIKEDQGGEVVVLHVGGAESEMIIRKALAIGADRAIRVDKEPVSSLDVATQIHAHASSQGYDLILLGKETIDHNGSEVGSILAGLLDLPYVSYATQLILEGGKAIVDRDIEGGSEKIESNLPLVISAAKGMAEQRIPNMRGIMMAKRKPLEVMAPVDFEPRVTLESFVTPPAKQGVKMIDENNMDELVRLLHEEAKVI